MLTKIYIGTIMIGVYLATIGALLDQAKRPWIPYWTTEEMYVALRFGKICLTEEVCPFNGIMKRYEESGDGERHKDRPQPMASKEDLEKLREALKEVLQILDGAKK